MTSEVNQEAGRLYGLGKSTTEVAAILGIPASRARRDILSCGISFRPSAEAMRAAMPHRKSREKGGKQSDQARANMREAHLKWGRENARGVSLKPNGYLEYTRGPHKGRLVHVVLMEERIGRRLAKNEVVHHDDENRANNSPENLFLMTRIEHSRLHRLRKGPQAQGKDGRFIREHKQCLVG